MHSQRTERPRVDVLAWAALLAALVVTAYSEYGLAVALGFNEYVAAGVPAALDIYAIRALRVHRDVLAVVLAMIVVNSAAHLYGQPVDWVRTPLTIAVSAIAPLVLWRVHVLREVHPAPEYTPVPADVPEPASAPVLDENPQVMLGTPVVGYTPEVHPEPAPVQLYSDPQPYLSLVPAPTSAPAPTEEAECAPAPEKTVETVPVPEVASAPLKKSALAVPAFEDDAALVARVRADYGDNLPSLRKMKSEYGIGQVRAQRVLAVLAS